MRLIRLFVSSTFADFQIERALLHDAVFPRVARYCERHGLTFQPVDLRWGVTGELAADQKTMQVCLAEIRRSRNLSPRPNCLILLGDRYGWRPLPDMLDSETHSMLALLADPFEARVLEAAYALDTNAVPPAYRLRRGDEHGLAGALDEACLRALLERGAACMDDPGRRAALSGAATHQEVLAALGEPARAGEVVAWLRAFDRVPERASDDLLVGDYLHDGQADCAAAAELTRLKNALRAALPKTMIAADTVSLSAYRDGGPAMVAYVRRFARHVLRRLLCQIRMQLTVLRVEADAGVDLEDAAHRRFGSARCEGLRGRDAELAAIASHLNGTANHPLVLTGPGGSGKSSIMASAAGRLRRGVDIVRFVGATPASTSLRGMVADLCARLDRAYRPQAAHVPLSDGEPLAAALGERLRLVGAERPLYLLVDALDQFPPAQQASMLRWLPPTLPPHVHVLLSCRDGFSLPPRVATLAVPPLPATAARRLLEDWLGAHGRTLTAGQRAAVEAGYAACPLPLWLRLASEQALQWHSDNVVSALPLTLDGMVSSSLAGLRRRHAPVLLTQALAYIGASRYGLSELELARLLAADLAVRAEFERNSHHPWDVVAHGLPQVLWSRLRLDLGPYLIERGVDGTLLLAFFHREFAEVVVRDLVAPQAHAIHATLAAHFAHPAGPDLALRAERGNVPALRRLSEQAFQLLAAGDHAGLENVLGDFAYAMAKCGVVRLPELLQEHAAVARPAALVAWRDFLRSHAGSLAQADATWPAYKVLLQLAQEQAEAHPVAQASQAWLATGACTWRWARRELRPAVLQAHKILAQFPVPAGEEDPFRKALELEGDRIATIGRGGSGADESCSFDATVRIWNAASGLLEHELAEHGGSVFEILALPGERVATVATDGWLRVWSAASGACLAVCAAKGARQLALLDGRRLLVACSDPPRNECRSLDDLTLLASAALDLWSNVYGLGNGQALLAHGDAYWTGAQDQQDDQVCYWLWEVDGASQAEPVRLDYRRRLSAADGSTLLWSANASTLLLLGGGATRRSAILPAPATDARLVEGFGAAVALADGRIVLLAWSGALHVLLNPHGVPSTADSSECEDDGRWGVCVLSDGSLLSWRSASESGYAVLRWRCDGILLGSWGGPGWLSGLVPGPENRVLARYVYRSEEGSESTHPVECWNGTDGRVLATMHGHFNFVDHVSWLPGGRVLSWSEDDGTVRTWDAGSGSQLALFNVEGFIRFVLPLADGSLLASGFNALFRFNLDFRDEPALPCGGLQMPDGLALAWDDAESATLWRSSDRHALSAVDNSGDIARVRRCGDGLLMWDRTLRHWTLWADGDRRLLATVLPDEFTRDEDDAAFRLFGDVLISLIPQESGEVLMQRHKLDGSGTAEAVRLNAPWFECIEETYVLSPHCAALLSKKGLAVHVVQGGKVIERQWRQRQRLGGSLLLASGMVCCFGRTLSLWNGDGELAVSRLLQEVPVELVPLPAGCLLVCMPSSVLALHGDDLGQCWEHRGTAPFRYWRASPTADGRLLLESRYRNQTTLEVIDAAGAHLCRLTDLPSPGKAERMHMGVSLDVDAPRPQLQDDTLLVFGESGRWQRWNLATRRLCGDYGGIPKYADAQLLDGGRLLWATGHTPCLFDTANGKRLAAAQPERSGIWLRAAPFSDTGKPGLALLGASGWEKGEQVFWTHSRHRGVVALSDAPDGRMLLKGANHFSKHQHSGFWVRLMLGALPQPNDKDVSKADTSGWKLND